MSRWKFGLTLLTLACLVVAGCGRNATKTFPGASPTAPGPQVAGLPSGLPDDEGPPRAPEPRPGRPPGFLQEQVLQPTPGMIAPGTNVFDAVRRGQVQVLMNLLAATPSAASSTDPQGRTPLHFTTRRKMVALLLAQGAKVDARDQRGNTPLITIATRGGSMIVPLLVSAGADVNAVNNAGMTALHEAARTGTLDLMKILIENGAKVDIASKDGVTPIMMAVGTRSQACVELLVEHSASLSSRDIHGNTVLHIATLGGLEAILEYLMSKGADPNAQNEGGNTPLHVCVLTDHSDTALLFLKKGASLTVKNKAGQTPVELAQSLKDKFMVDVLQGKAEETK